MSQIEDQAKLINELRELLQQNLNAASRKHSGTADDVSALGSRITEVERKATEAEKKATDIDNKLFRSNGTESFSTVLRRAVDDIEKLKGVEYKREDDKTGLWNHVKRSGVATVVSTLLISILGGVLILTKMVALSPAPPPPVPKSEVSQDAGKSESQKQVEEFMRELKEIKKRLDDLPTTRRNARRPPTEPILPPGRSSVREPVWADRFLPLYGSARAPESIKGRF